MNIFSYACCHLYVFFRKKCLRHMKRRSTSLIIREIQIKTALRYYLTPVRVTKINSGNKRCWLGCGEREALLHCRWECKLPATLESSVYVPQKIKNKITVWPSNSTTRIYPKNTLMLIHRGTYTPIFIAALSTTAKLWKELRRPSADEWIKKMQ